jgi:hypothetical protein
MTAPPSRGAAERFAAWIYTGPLGHLWSTGVDVVTVLPRELANAAWRRASRLARGLGVRPGR